MGTIIAIVWFVGFWASVLWVFQDARNRNETLPAIHAVGVAITFPVGILIYHWLRD